ncbi:uncharacterized protein LOC113003321 isoform X1 [Solenopsis invicta]|uniref:uncharacterized protein LOC113003321 isoform X1 n=1 Tax=Solenopsis invicta TaxID=13686 RepID=UPI00193DB6FC|nr:uncharacterized protein LOC113003321 isoform X1 [Solenopsis invicta]
MDYNVDLFLNVCSVIGPIIYYTFTYFGMLTNQNKTKEFIEQVRYSWNSLKEKEELKIIHTHANIGRFYAIIGSRQICRIVDNILDVNILHRYDHVANLENIFANECAAHMCNVSNY